MVFNGMTLRNNSAIKLTEVLDRESSSPPENALVCFTNRIPCCSAANESWYNPDGSKVSETLAIGEFYQSYAPDDQSILLHRTIQAYPSGLFTCAILDRDNITRHLYVGSGELTIVSLDTFAS